MKKLLSLALFLSLFCVQAEDKIRLGWQVPWALQGQLVQVLKHTDIAKNEGLDIEFIGRTYGPLLNELALGAGVDIILTADQPAAILFSKDKGWKAIGRLMYNRTSTYVTPSSKIKSMKELKGKTIGVPIGAAAERVTSGALKNVGVDPIKEVKWVNVDIREHIPLAKRHKKDINFGNFDALSGFDPTPALLEAMGLVRAIDVGKVVSLILANEQISSNEKLAKKIILVFEKAYEYYRTHLEEVDGWFMVEALLPDNSHKACRIAETLEPNMKVGAKISLTLSDYDLMVMQEASDFVKNKIGREIKMRDHIVGWALSK